MRELHSGTLGSFEVTRLILGQERWLKAHFVNC